METKQITKAINWLDAIDGLTPEQAIAYLQTLPPDYKLSHYMEGDTHGCEIVASMYKDIPLTNAEILKKRTDHYNKEIATYEKALDGHIKAGRTERAESCQRLITNLKNKLADVQAKYK